MERCIMFLDWNNQHCENDYTTQSNLQIQCNPYQTANGGFPGGAVVESLPASAGDTGSSPGLGRSHMPQSN